MIKYLLIVTFLLYAISSNAKDISLKECIQFAMQNHPKIVMIKKDLQLAINNLKIIKADRNFQISAQVISYETPLADPSTFKVAGINSHLGIQAAFAASYALFNPQQKHKEKQYRLGIDLSRVTEKEAIGKVIITLKEAYYNYLYQKEVVKVHTQNFVNSKLYYDNTKKLFKNGVRSKLDINKSKVIYESAYLVYLQQKNILKQRKMYLLSAMGMEDTNYNINPQVISKLPELKYNVEELYTLAKLYNTSVLKHNLAIKQHKIAIAMSKAIRYPSAVVSFAFGTRSPMFFNFVQNGASSEEIKNNTNYNNFEMFGGMAFGINLPLYYGGKISTQIDSAVIKYNKIIYSKKDVLIQVKTNVITTYNGIKDLKKHMTIQKLNIKNAKALLALTIKGYNSGVGTQENLAHSEVNVLNNQLKYSEFKYTYLRLINHLTGHIGLNEEQLCKK